MDAAIGSSQAQASTRTMSTLEVPRLSAAPPGFDGLGELLARGASVLLAHQWPPEPARTPAQVWLGHSEDHLWLYARVPDAKVVTQATAPNQPMWELGDTFEMFFQGGSDIDYTELHVTPPNYRLQLRLPAARRIINEEFERHLLPDPMFYSQTQIEPGGWSILAGVRSKFIQFDSESMSGRQWRFSFCRYDYDAVPGEPVLSSSSPHSELDFHRRQDWGTLRFAD